MYNGYLEYFYRNHSRIGELSYMQHYETLINDSTEFVASYIRTFNKLGIEANCVIDNDKYLQNKWMTSNGLKFASKQKIILQQVVNYKPDVLWIDDLRFIDGPLLEKIKQETKSIKLICAYHCSPFNSEIIRKFRGLDFIFTCTPGLKEDLECKGLKSYLVYHGFDTDLLSRINTGNSNNGNGFVFTGSLFQGDGTRGERIELVERILDAKIGLSVYLYLEKKHKIRVKQTLFAINKLLTEMKIEKLKKTFPVLAHINAPVRNYPDIIVKENHSPLFGIEMYKLLRMSGIVLNIHGSVSGNYAGNMRMFEATGVGSCLLTDNKSNLNELFDTGCEIVAYDNIDDCIEKALWLLQNEEKRRKIALSGQQRTLRMHKVEDRCRRIMEIFRNELLMKSRSHL